MQCFHSTKLTKKKKTLIYTAKTSVFPIKIIQIDKNDQKIVIKTKQKKTIQTKAMSEIRTSRK